MKRSSTLIKSGSTLFLKMVILFIGIGVLALCIFVLPAEIRATDWNGYRPILLGMYVPAIPFFIALYHGFFLLNSIDKNNVFSKASVKALRSIKYCGFTICGLYALGMPYIFSMAQKDDAPGVAMLGFIFVFGSLVVGIAATVFQNQLQKVIDIKSENELTV